jgi:formate hydrogenlyase transcriptional activator
MMNERRSPDSDPSKIFSQPDAFAEPEKLLAAYFSSQTIGLAVTDSNLRCIAINETLARMNGITAVQHLGKTPKEVLGDFGERIETELRRVLETGEPVHVEISRKPSEGIGVGHWMAHYLPIKDENGKVTAIGGVVVETTSQRKLERSLEETNEKLAREMSRLGMLLEVGNLLSVSHDVPKVFPQISERMRVVLQHDYAGVAIHDASTGLLVRQAHDFPSGKGLAANIPIAADNSPSGRALQAGTSLILSRREIESFDAPIAQSFIDEGMQSLCCVPLPRPKGPLGVLVLGSVRPDAFRAEDLGLLNQVAAQLAIALENYRTTTEIEDLKQRLTAERKFLAGETRSEGPFDEIVGDSPTLRQVLEQVATVATSEATVLILGETGTGKELVARAIHRMSQRRDDPFVKVNCAAIPTGLLESELFGHEKGAFTGAVSQKVGRMELANRGTLFLDEVGEIPLDLQPKLLRVLQDQEFERLGGTKTIKVNVRVVAATNRNLARDMAEGEFRTDLFYRLNVFPIRMPALRERAEDIPILVRYFVRKFAERMGREIESVPSEAMRALREWTWPGNVRELENLMERSIILSEGRVLCVPLEELRATDVSILPHEDETLGNAEREHILRMLRETKGQISGPDGAAARLGLKRTTLQSKMKRLRIHRTDYLKPI